MSETFDFSEALLLLKDGKRMARHGWNLDHAFVCAMPGMHLNAACSRVVPFVNEHTAQHIGNACSLQCQSYLAFIDSCYNWQPGWTPTQADLFAIDWFSVHGTTRLYETGMVGLVDGSVRAHLMHREDDPNSPWRYLHPDIVADGCSRKAALEKLCSAIECERAALDELIVQIRSKL